MSSELESLIGKEGMTAFFTELKNALQTTEKTNEKSLIDFSIMENILVHVYSKLFQLLM